MHTHMHRHAEEFNVKRHTDPPGTTGKRWIKPVLAYLSL